MNPAQRLVTSITIDHVGEARLHEAGIDIGRQMITTVVLQVELSDGRRVVLLDDRGWAAGGPGDIWSYETFETMAQTARTVVGPDEPPEGRSFEEETALHWAALADIAEEQGVAIEASELAGLRHDVEASADIHARLVLKRAACGRLKG